MGTLPKVSKRHVRDSSVVQLMACGRTKSTTLTKNVVENAAKGEFVAILKQTKFSIIFDESTDLTMNTDLTKQSF